MTFTLEWQCDLERGFKSDRSVIGLALKSEIMGRPVQVLFPATPEGERTGALRPPQDKRGRTYDEPGLWGVFESDIGTQPATAVVRRVLLQGQAESEAETAIEEILAATAEWAERFLTWIEIYTGQCVSDIGHRPPNIIHNRWMPFNISDEPPTHLHAFSPMKLVCANTSGPASKELVGAALDEAASQHDPELAWILIRDARSLRFVNQHRRSVVDAGAAAEIAIKNILMKAIPAAPPDITLGSAAGRLEKAGYQLPLDFWTALHQVRNDVVHMNPAASTVGAPESNQAIEIATALVETAWPLRQPHLKLW
ncbi:hypothetical protein [Nocardia sp. NPDC005366]|uniref:hypothetical protein n=1 Tax=Nocardia sp. NPDC005366 TaxID=3156878 RepID=UPI0033A5D6AB